MRALIRVVEGIERSRIHQAKDIASWMCLWLYQVIFINETSRSSPGAVQQMMAGI